MSRQQVFTVIQDKHSKKWCISRKTLKIELFNLHIQPSNIQKQQSKLELNNLQGKHKSSKTRIKPSIQSYINQLDKSKANSEHHRNDVDNNQKHNELKNSFFSASKIYGMTKKDLQFKIADNRVNDGTRFFIRKKAKSNYCKRQEFPIFQKQIDFQQKIIQKSKEKNAFKIVSNFTDLSIINEDNNVVLQISSSYHPNALMVKAVACKQSKNNGRLMTQIKEKDMLAKGEQQNKPKIASMNSIGKMIKQIGKISKCDSESNQNSKNTSIKKDGQSEGNLKLLSNSTIKKDINKNPSRLQKIKAYNGCKTIRVLWGQNKQHFINNNLIKQRKVRRESIISDNKNDVFEGFSVLSNKPSYISSVPERDSDPPIESLRELYQCLWPNEDEIHRQDEMLMNGSSNDI